MTEQTSILAPSCNGPPVANTNTVRFAILFPMIAGWIIPSCALAQNLVTPSQTVTTVDQTEDVVTEPQPAAGPITAYERLEWFTKSSIGPASLGGGLFSAGWGTLLDRPHEYGAHWEGFGERYGIRMSGILTQNAMEASLGAIWGKIPAIFERARAPR